MATHLYEHRAELPRNRLAWFASLAVHAGALASLAYVSWATFRGSHSLQPSREPSVVFGLSDGNQGDEPRDQAVRAPSAAPSSETDFGDGLANAAAAHAVPLADEGSELLTPAPRLPLVSLGGIAPSASAPPPRGARPIRVGDIADRATVTVFGAVGEGSRFVYLFDHSTSMEGAPLAAAKAQLVGSLDALSSVHQFQVIFFNHHVQAWDHTGGQRRIPYASDANKRLAAMFVRSVVATGATDRLAALRRALAMNADVVFFLTDADDAMPAYDVAEVVERAQRNGTAIACIEFGAGPQPEGGNFLSEIAAATRGDYVYVDVTQLSGGTP